MGGEEPGAHTGVMFSGRITQVFIVDDSAAIRLRLQQMLARCDGIAIVGEAGELTDAIDRILALRPHSVLLDLNLYGRSGLEVLRAVRIAAPEVVFVVLTNHAEPQYRRACSAAGARYFLDKSRDFERVPEILAEIAAAH